MATVTEKVADQLEKVKEGVKESLLGVELEGGNELSAQTRQDFMSHAIKDEETGEYYMGAEEFVNAVAPAGEDYVGFLDDENPGPRSAFPPRGASGRWSWA